MEWIDVKVEYRIPLNTCVLTVEALDTSGESLAKIDVVDWDVVGKEAEKPKQDRGTPAQMAMNRFWRDNQPDEDTPAESMACEVEPIVENGQIVGVNIEPVDGVGKLELRPGTNVSEVYLDEIRLEIVKWVMGLDITESELVELRDWLSPFLLSQDD